MTERLRILVNISNFSNLLWRKWQKNSPIRMSLNCDFDVLHHVRKKPWFMTLYIFRFFLPKRTKSRFVTLVMSRNTPDQGTIRNPRASTVPESRYRGTWQTLVHRFCVQQARRSHSSKPRAKIIGKCHRPGRADGLLDGILILHSNYLL